MKIAVTAANGQLGSSVVKELVKVTGSEQVIGIARTPEKASHLGIEIRKGVYEVASDFEKAVGRPHKSTVEMIKDFRGKK